jgi:predicted Ser/Thr protein kinase
VIDDPELFEAVMRLPTEQRDAAVRGACGDDASRAQRLLELIQVATEADIYALDEAPLRLEKGEHFGRYCIVSLLGEGSFGQVYDALDLELERRIALKVLHEERTRSASDDRRFRREAKALARIDHPNVVRVYDAGQVQGRRYLAMELLEGTSLRPWIRGATKLRWSSVLERLLPAARGLAAAHEAGIVHRDFKPENVMLDEAKDRVVVADFGIARRAESDSMSTDGDAPKTEDTLATGSSLGTPAYMAPEQFYGEASAKSDQYAFCKVVLEALGSPARLPLVTASRPEGSAAEPFADLRAPRWLRRVLAKGTAVAPSDRYADMPTLVEALGQYQRRRRGSLTGLLVVLATLPGAYALTRPAAADPCEAWDAKAAEAGLESAWDSMEAAASEGPSATLVSDLRGRAHRDLDRWASARTESCRQHAAGLIDAATAEARDQCFGRWQERLTRRVRWGSEHPEMLSSPRLAEAFPEQPEACAYVAPAGAQAEVVALSTRLALDRAIDRAEELWILGRYDDSGAAAEAALAKAREVGHEAYTAEALLQLGILAARRGAFERAETVLFEGLELAQRQGQESLVYALQYHLAETMLLQGTDRGLQVEPLLVLARAQLDRLGVRSLERAKLQVFTGHLAFLRGELGASRDAYRSAALAFDRLGEALEAASAREHLAESLSLDGRHEDALALATEVLHARVDSLGGPNHPILIQTYLKLAGIWMRAGTASGDPRELAARLDVAAALVGDAEPLAREVGGADSAFLARALTLRVHLARLQKKTDDAVARDAVELVSIVRRLEDDALDRPHRLQALRAARNVYFFREEWDQALSVATMLVDFGRPAAPTINITLRDDELILVSLLLLRGELADARLRLQQHDAAYASSGADDQQYQSTLSKLYSQLESLSTTQEDDD